jgi:hypothetical protein
MNDLYALLASTMAGQRSTTDDPFEPRQHAYAAQLGYRLVDVFKNSFSEDDIALFHQALSQKEKWIRDKNYDITIDGRDLNYNGEEEFYNIFLRIFKKMISLRQRDVNHVREPFLQLVNMMDAKHKERKAAAKILKRLRAEDANKVRTLWDQEASQYIAYLTENNLQETFGSTRQEAFEKILKDMETADEKS